MKTLKLFVSLLVIAFIAISTSVNAQTFQQKLTAVIEDVLTPCYNRNVSGSYVLNCTYHLDNKTGKIDRIHFNVIQCDVWDTETGERVIVHDSGNDNLGYYWDFINRPNYYNGIPDMYNVEDGWLNDFMPETLPTEGTLVEMNWRYNLKGEGNLNLSTLVQIHQNAKGQVTVDMAKSWVDCNE